MFAVDAVRSCLRLLVGILLFWWGTTLPLSARAQSPIPSELQPWVPWVLEDHPHQGCILTASDAPCVWPGRVDVEVNSTSGRFRMRVRVDRATWVAIPGGPGQWPVEVWSNLGPATVAERDGRPAIWLDAGSHTVTGRVDWEAQPQSLALPAAVGLVTLSVAGEAVDHPRLDATGRLPLTVSGDLRTAEGDAVELDVTRHIADGVPVRIRTRMDLRVAGSARELQLGEILLQGTVPVAIDSQLPVRIGEGKPTVSTQVRPGTWTITIDAIAEGPVSQLTAPQVSFASWPDAEFWSVATNDAVRSLTLNGGIGVEPGRTPIPADYHTHPAYILQQGDTLGFEEMRRGVPAPPPSELSVQRSIWVDSSGEGLTTQDRISGTMQDGWRLNVAPPMVLGHVSVDGTDRVVTTDEAGTGVEVRGGRLSVVGESRLPSPWKPVPAVGWALDAQSLNTTIHTAPGWTLLAVSGADTAQGTALSGWSVIDVFLVLVLVGAIARLFGLRTAVLAAIALGLSVQDEAAPGVLWLAAAAASAADDQIRARSGVGSAARIASRVVAIGFGALLTLQLAQYVSVDLPQRTWPALNADVGTATPASVEYEASEASAGAAPEPSPARSVKAQQERNLPPTVFGKRAKPQSAKPNLYQTLQEDPAAVVQTGPGIPGWSGNTAQLTWSGRVSSEHTIQLFLLPPLATRIGALLKAFLLIWLALRVVRLDRFWTSTGRRWWKNGLPLLALLAAGAALAPSAGHAAPSPELLKELESRLTAPSECADACTSASRARITVRDLGRGGPPRIRIEAEVHAVEAASWAVPGPLTSWRPTSVRLDAYETIETRRGSDGFLHVRVPEGVHIIVMEGDLTSSDGMTLQFADAPQAIRFDGPGFRMAGARRDGTVDDTLQLTRIQVEGTGAVSRSSDNLAPWVTVERNLDLGIPWRVTTVVRRHGSPTSPLTLEIPLLPGEALTDASHEVRDGKVLAAFDGSDGSVRWTGTLALTDLLRLEAPRDVSWTERWSLACSPVFSCSTTTSTGLAPVAHVVDGRWQPTYRPWPGETLEVAIVRPESIPGQTVTIDALSLTTTPLTREAESVLELSMRTSQGGQHPITLSPEATLLSLEVDGKAVAGRMREGTLDVPLQPGSHRVRARWSEPLPIGLVSSVAAVDPGAPAVNTTITLDLSGTNADWRWVVWSEAGQYGTKALHVFCVGGWMVVAWLLGRFFGPGRTGAPFPTSTWAVLLLGMSTLPPLAVMVVLIWLTAVIVRSRRTPEHWAAYNLFQLALLLGIPIVGIILFATIGMNLLDRPTLWFEGPGNGRLGRMVWSIDRLDGALPQPGVVSLPGWSWRGLVLAWCLGLVVAVARRATWLWSTLGHGGWLRRAPQSPRDPRSGPPAPGGGSSGPSTPDASPGVAPTSADDHPSSATVDGPEPADGADPAFEETVIMAAEFQDSESDDLELDSGEIELGEEDGWVYEDSAALVESPLPEGQTQATFGGVAGVSVIGTHRKPARPVPAVELPYNPDRHVEIGPPAHDEDAIFVPALDADPADYEVATARSRASVDAQEE